MGGVTGHHAGVAPDRLRHPRHLLRRGPLPPGALRDGRLRRVRRPLLLVPQDVRPHAAREPGQVALLADVHRLLDHLHAPVRGRPARHAAPCGLVPVEPRLAELQRRLDGRRLHHRGVLRLPPGELRRVVAQARSRPATTPGTPTRSSGSPPRRRRTTTTPTCRRSAPSARRGTTTTPTPSTSRTARRPTRNGQDEREGARRRYEGRVALPAVPRRLLRGRRASGTGSGATRTAAA